MGRKIIKKGWLYEYEETAEKQLTNGYEVTRVMYWENNLTLLARKY